MKLLTAAVLLSLLTLSCGLTGPDRIEESRNNMRAQRKQWQAQSITSYTYHVRKLCFCGDTRATTVVVVNGAVASATFDDSGEAVPANELSRIYTVEAIFDVIDAALDRRADALSAAYDSALHYPTDVQIDYIRNAIDDELSVSANGLQRK
jgi:hypothetical protein